MNMRSSGGHANTETDGFIVVAVLWIIGALAAFASIYAVYIATTTASFAANDDRVKAEAAISASLELTAYQLSGAPKDSSPARGAFGFRLGRANVAVGFLSESARIDLNAASKELLAGLFAALGAQPEDAKDYASRIVAWRTPLHTGAADNEVSLYRAAGLPYGPREAPFANVDELWLVRGLPPELVERALPDVTVFSGQSGVDVLNAAPDVIAAMPGMSPARLDTVLRQRRAAPQDNKSLLALLGPAQVGVATTGSNATRVTVRVNFDNGRRVNAEAVIAVAAGANRPYRVLSWHDDLDGPLPADHSRLASR